MKPKSLYDRCVRMARLNPEFKFLRKSWGLFEENLGCALTCAYRLNKKFVSMLLKEHAFTIREIEDFVGGFDAYFLTGKEVSSINLKTMEEAGRKFNSWVTKHNRWHKG